MLLLSRKQDERILIGDGIEVQVLGIRRGQVRLGITCPDDAKVLRQELIPTSLAAETSESLEESLKSHAGRQRDLIDRCEV